MEFLFIKKIIDTQIFNKVANIDIKDIFNYYPTKTNLISFCNNDNSNEGNDYDFVIDCDAKPLDDKEEEERKQYLNSLKEELLRTTKVFEYLITNLEIPKTKIGNYKVYNYDNTSKHIKSKIKGNHNLDVKYFILKNKINRDDIISKIKEMGVSEIENDDLKIMIYFILIKIIDIYNTYNKCLVYSINLLEEYPFTIRNKSEYLSVIDNKFINITNDEINIYHHNLIKNAYNSNNKLGETIYFKKNKNFEILFK